MRGRSPANATERKTSASALATETLRESVTLAKGETRKSGLVVLAQAGNIAPHSIRSGCDFR